MRKSTKISTTILIIILFFGSFYTAPIFLHEAYAVVLASVDETLKILMPEADNIEEEIKILTEEQMITIAEKGKLSFDPNLDQEFHFYIGKSNNQIIGYAVTDAVRGKWGLIHYMILLDPNGTIKNLKVLEYGEKRGKPVAKRRFLKQFFGKTINNRLRLKKDIRGVTGATISSRGLTNGIRKIVHVFNELYL